MNKPSSLFLLLVLLVLSLSMLAQDSKEHVFYQVETTDGSVFKGRLVYEDETSLKLESETLGEIMIPRVNVVRIKTLGSYKKVGTAYWAEYPQDTRYFWAPAGYGLRKGEGYYQNVWIYFNQVVYGVSDHFSMGLGTIPLVLFFGESTPVWITPKVSFELEEDKISLGFGGLFGAVLGEDIGFGILYGVTTFGSRQKNISFGMGWGYADEDFASSPVFNVSALYRLGPKGYLVSENYYFPGDNAFGLLSLGGRSLLGKVGLDYGGVIPLGEDTGVNIIPWLGVTVPF